MRVYHVPRRFALDHWGGTESVIEATCAIGRECGQHHEIFTTNALCAVSQETHHHIAIQRFPYFYPEWPLSSERKNGYDRKGGNLFSPQLIKGLKSSPKPDIFHLHTGNRLGAQVFRYAKRHHIPTVITLHGGHFVIPQDEHDHLQQKQARKGVEWGRIVSAFLGTRRLLNQVDAIICVGREEFDAAQQQLPKHNIHFLPGGVDLDFFRLGNGQRINDELNTAGQPLLVCCARLDQQKDQATLVAAWRRTREQTAHHQAHLALVGAETTPGYEEQLRELAGPHVNHLHLTGDRPKEWVRDLYHAAQVVCLPSRHEPFGLVCLEAWASGQAILASDIGGPSWLLREGGGEAVPAGDSQAWQQAISRALDHQEAWQAKGHRAQRELAPQYAWHKRCERLFAIYDNLCNKLPTS
jgi:glycosyltransferase involved in cell wall biosynthesis